MEIAHWFDLLWLANAWMGWCWQPISSAFQWWKAWWLMTYAFPENEEFMESHTLCCCTASSLARVCCCAAVRGFLISCRATVWLEQCSVCDGRTSHMPLLYKGSRRSVWHELAWPFAKFWAPKPSWHDSHFVLWCLKVRCRFSSCIIVERRKHLASIHARRFRLHWVCDTFQTAALILGTRMLSRAAFLARSLTLFVRCSFATRMNFSSDQRERDLINVERKQCVDARFGNCCLDQLLKRVLWAVEVCPRSC